MFTAKQNLKIVILGALGLVFAVILFASVLFGSIIYFIKHSNSYKTAINYIESQSKISADIGGIEGYGFVPHATINISNGYGIGKFNIKVKGQDKDINVYLNLEKMPGSDWIVKDAKY